MHDRSKKNCIAVLISRVLAGPLRGYCLGLNTGVHLNKSQVEM